MSAQPGHGQRWRFWLILLFASINGVLYAVLVPLWGGFDEAFHYAYVQELSTRGRLPVLGKSGVSQEVWSSLLMVPVSHVVQHDFPVLRTYAAYFALPDDQRKRRANIDETLTAAIITEQGGKEKHRERSQDCRSCWNQFGGRGSASQGA